MLSADGLKYDVFKKTKARCDAAKREIGLFDTLGVHVHHFRRFDFHERISAPNDVQCAGLELSAQPYTELAPEPSDATPNGSRTTDQLVAGHATTENAPSDT